MSFVGGLAVLAGVAGGAFFFGGYYNIAATEADPGYVASALVRVRQASIRQHATAAPPVTFLEPASVQAGARAYAAAGCANCHGGPGVPWAKFSEGLNPGPPDLKEVAPTLAPRELFWVIRNGIRMTGMPSFNLAGVPDDKIWNIVGFVTKLPSVTEEEYKTWTAEGAN